MLTSCLRCRSALAQDTQHLCAHLKLSISFCAGVLLKKPARLLEISSLLYSINTEMKACCETDRSRSNIYKQFICRFVKGDSEVCGGSFLKLGKSAKLVLKVYFTEFTRSLNQKLHCRMQAGGGHACSKGSWDCQNGYLRLSFHAVVSLQPTPPPKKKQGLKCLQSLFLAKSHKKKGKETFKWHRRVQKHDSLAAKWKTVVTLCCAMALFQCVD